MFLNFRSEKTVLPLKPVFNFKTGFPVFRIIEQIPSHRWGVIPHVAKPPLYLVWVITLRLK